MQAPLKLFSTVALACMVVSPLPAAAQQAASASVLPKPTPKPLPQEARHSERYDAAISAVRDRALSPDDAARIREAVAATAKDDPAKAKALRNLITDATGRKLIDWYLYRSGYGTAAEIRAFMAANPAWPDHERLEQRAEEALFNSTATPREVKAFFADTPPATGVGLAALGWALAAENDTAAAERLAGKAWVESSIPAGQEARVLEKIGSLLTEGDHKRRLDRLLMSAPRWAAKRNERAIVIRRTIALLSAPEKKKAQARLAVFLQAKNSSKLMGELSPEDIKTEWGLAVQRAQQLRRQDKHEAAWKILLDEPEATLRRKPDGWWEERRAAAYAALAADKPKTAYELVRDSDGLSVNAKNDALFMAGWIALRHLHDGKKALPHFQTFTQTADGPLTRGRSNYWLGRTYEALGQADNARQNYRVAAAQIDTFHGQLAHLKLNPGASTIEVKPPATPTAEEIARFNSLDAVQAIVIANKAGLDRWTIHPFLNHLRFYFTTEAQAAMLAHLAEALGDTQMAVRIGKTAVGRGLNLMYYAYPIHKLPAYTPLRRPAETALILSIARQESEFNTLTLSGAGARGILQVMPITARHICRDYKLKCDIARLMHDPAYNTMMGSAYIADRMDEFSGSYILTLAGYNAGPGRARQWIRQFGDPRHSSIDPIDWIHRIPFEETREYVQKVLSNVQIYRARLGETNAVRLTSDLVRVTSTDSIKASAAD